MEVLLKSSLTALVLGAFALAPAHAFADPLKVVASFTIIADFAQQVGGDRIALTSLVGPNGDPHVYEPKPSDAVAMAKADVVLVNGLAFEGYLDRLVEASGTKAPIVSLSDGIDVIASSEADDHDHGAEDHDDHDDEAHDDHADAEHDDHDHAADEHDHEDDDHAEEGHHHGDFDPHAWLSVTNAKVYVHNIEHAFCQIDAEGCPVYEANAEAYLEKLDALDAEIHAKVDALPADRRTIVTSHAAFAYFARDYGLTFLAPQGLSTDTEASAASVAGLITHLREDNVAALFTEVLSDPRVIEQIGAESGTAVKGALYTGALSKPDGPAPTYIDLMRYDIDAISNAILGS